MTVNIMLLYAVMFVQIIATNWFIVQLLAQVHIVTIVCLQLVH